MSFYGMFKDYTAATIDAVKTVTEPICEIIGVEAIKEDLFGNKDSIKKSKE